MRDGAPETAARLGRIAGAAPWTQNQFRGVLKFARRKPLGAIGLVIFLVAMLAAIFAPVLATADPLTQERSELLQGPSSQHFFGTDNFGRDLYSRIIYGARISLIVAFLSIGIGTVTGLLLGIVSGYIGGWVDTLIQRATEVMLAFPPVLLALALVAVLGSGLDKVIIAVSIVFGPQTLRVVRGTVLSVKQNVYVDAARTVGASDLRIMLRHILPNVMAPYLIMASVLLGSAIMIEATLSFLGLGVPPPHPSWGRMLSVASSEYSLIAPWMVIFPGMAITILVMGFNFFGDALRDVWDPKLRGGR